MKISENPRKGFFYNRRTKSKNEYIFELYITQALFCPLSQNFNTTRSWDSCLVGHPNVHKSSHLLTSVVYKVPYTPYPAGRGKGLIKSVWKKFFWEMGNNISFTFAGGAYNAHFTFFLENHATFQCILFKMIQI